MLGSRVCTPGQGAQQPVATFKDWPALAGPYRALQPVLYVTLGKLLTLQTLIPYVSEVSKLFLLRLSSLFFPFSASRTTSC